jgi:GTP cyclohydrolase II
MLSAEIRTRVTVPLKFADGYATTAEVITFTGLADGREHLALALGDVANAAVPLVRPHSECLTGDVFGSQRCDCGP